MQNIPVIIALTIATKVLCEIAAKTSYVNYTWVNDDLLAVMAWCITFRRLRLLGQKRASDAAGGDRPAKSSSVTKCWRWRRTSGRRRTPQATKWQSFALTRTSIGRLNLSSCMLHINHRWKIWPCNMYRDVTLQLRHGKNGCNKYMVLS